MPGRKQQDTTGATRGKALSHRQGFAALGHTGKKSSMESDPFKTQQDEGLQPALQDTPPAERTCRQEGAGDKTREPS